MAAIRLVFLVIACTALANGGSGGSGESGESGLSGESGMSGESGLSGESGMSGESGEIVIKGSLRFNLEGEDGQGRRVMENSEVLQLCIFLIRDINTPLRSAEVGSGDSEIIVRVYTEDGTATGVESLYTNSTGDYVHLSVEVAFSGSLAFDERCIDIQIIDDGIVEDRLEDFYVLTEVPPQESNVMLELTQERITIVDDDAFLCRDAGFTTCCEIPDYYYYFGGIFEEEFGSCLLPGGQCYCDFACHSAGDCCDDIQLTCPGFTLEPRAGNQLGGTPVLVTAAQQFEEQTDVFCVFGVTAVPGVIINESTILCVSPRLAEAGLVGVSVVVNGSVLTNQLVFTATTFNDFEYRDQTSSILLFTGNTISVTWNPSTVVPIPSVDPVDPNYYTVSINLYETTSGAFNLLATLASDISNSGQATVTVPEVEVQTSPVTGAILQIVVTGAPENSSALLSGIVASQAVGIWSFRGAFTTTLDLRSTCTQWCNSQPVGIGSVLTSRASFSCPPTLSQAQLPNSGVIQNFVSPLILEFYNPGAVACFLQSNPGLSGTGQECCYDDTGILTIGPPGGGSVDETSPLISEQNHFTNDLLPYIYCCKGIFPTCATYYQKRPSDDGSSFAPIPPACVYGDPHIVTLDNHKYTFNGYGEYWLVQSTNGLFSLQGRMIPASNSSGTPVAATVFSAFVLADSGSDTVQFELLDTGVFIALVNGQTIDFQVAAVQQFVGVTLRDDGNNTLVAIFSSGVYFEARVENGIISTVLFSLADRFQNNTLGLMGNFNGDPSDDLLPRFGPTNPLPLNSSLQTIHEDFGVTWIIDNEADSLFTYLGGSSWADFFQPGFTPIFETVFTDPALEAQALAICGNDSFCLYDIAATGRTDIGLGTLNGGLEFDQIVQMSAPVSCSPPCANGVCMANNTCSCAAGYDGDRCDQQVFSACTVNPCQNGGTCRMFVLDVICTCPMGFAGDFCQRMVGGMGGDPHYSVLLPSGQLLCFSVHGVKGFSFNLISNDLMVMNALFIQDPVREEITWIGSLGIVVKQAFRQSNVTKMRFQADTKKVYLGDEVTLEAHNIESLTLSKGKLSISEAVRKKSVKRMEVGIYLKDVGLSFSVRFVKNHLDLIWHTVEKQPNNSHGFIGQFFRSGNKVDEARKLLLLPSLDPVPVMRRKMWHFMESDVPDDQLCWVAMNPGYQGKQLIEGHYLDYLVNDVLTSDFKFVTSAGKNETK